MSLRDLLTVAPPRHGEGDTAPDHAAHGAEPGARYGATISEDEGALQAQATADAARERHLQASMATPEHAAPILGEVRDEIADETIVETFLIEPGAVVELLGRNPQRQNVDISNQSGAENAAGAGVQVYIFRTRTDAQSFVNAQARPTSGRFALIADGGARNDLKSAAPMFAAVRGDAASFAVVDVVQTVYRRRNGRA